ncbi:NfeD family protein [Paludibaculum fermentans]|uniref:NfeD family protein n=1 Tax=Paludibaculum fermentans TaxID=1473598 RepID=A0A7S7SPR6_PALFE|nr:NfeD family protein [Paludibaculum fermentans]QOY91435.1 NfeD family protein [Paludibaculum fermentans]
MGSYFMTWWAWLVIGLLLLAGEILTPGGFYLIFFGVAALLVGLVKMLGFEFGLALEGLLFVAASVAGLMFFRKPLLERFRKLTPVSDVDNLTNEIASAMEEIPVQGIGKVELRGTSWNARNVSETLIPKSTRCRVERVDGLTLEVRSL